MAAPDYPYNRLEEYLSAIEQNTRSGGGGSGGGGVFVVTKTSDLSTGESTLDKTWQEIYDAIKVNGQYPMVIWEQDDGPLRIGTVFEIGESNGYYGVFACEIAYDFAAAIQVTEFYTQSADGYPSTETD